jgi:hypothetical protein
VEDPACTPQGGYSQLPAKAGLLREIPASTDLEAMHTTGWTGDELAGSARLTSGGVSGRTRRSDRLTSSGRRGRSRGGRCPRIRRTLRCVPGPPARMLLSRRCSASGTMRRHVRSRTARTRRRRRLGRSRRGEVVASLGDDAMCSSGLQPRSPLGAARLANIRSEKASTFCLFC